MTLDVIRVEFTPDSTRGELYVDGAFECYTLEDTYRNGDIYITKVPGKTAIPLGTYPVILSQSIRFKRLLPEIKNVPNFSGVRIHSGNTSADTEGCILVGKVRSKNRVGESVNAFNELFSKMKARLPHEPCTLTIINQANPIIT